MRGGPPACSRRCSCAMAACKLERHLDRLGASAAQLYGATLTSGLDTRAREHAAPLIGLHRLRIDALPAPGSPGASGSGDESPDLDIDPTATALDPSRPDRYACAPRRLPEGHGPHKLRDRTALGERPGAPVPLIVDDDGTVLEAAWANVWLLRERTLVTPPLDGRILPGTTRARLLELAPTLGSAVREELVKLEDLRAAPVSR